MDNDLLINEARQLYAVLQARQAKLRLADNTNWLTRLERLIIGAYCRYQRRLNRCVLCYQQRNYDCIRIPGEKIIPCAPHHQADTPISGKA
jgi:hypothetical protein